MIFSSMVNFLVAAVPVAASAIASVQPVIPKTLPFGMGQCGGKGYTGPTDCYDPNGTQFLCVVVTDHYWACAYPKYPNYSKCADPKKGPKNGEICYIGKNTVTGNAGPNCCANARHWQCVDFDDGMSRCLEVKRDIPPPPTVTTTTTSATPSPTPCVGHYGQCGGVGFSKCCVDEPIWTCIYENAYFSNCFQTGQNTTLSTLVTTTKPSSTAA